MDPSQGLMGPGHAQQIDFWLTERKRFHGLERHYKHMLSDRNQVDYQDSGWQL